MFGFDRLCLVRSWQCCDVDDGGYVSDDDEMDPTSAPVTATSLAFYSQDRTIVAVGSEESTILIYKIHYKLFNFHTTVRDDSDFTFSSS